METTRPPRLRSRKGWTRRRVIVGIVVGLAVLGVALGGRVLGLYVDWLWFGEVGLRSVFWTRFWARLLVGLAGGAAFFAVVWANAELARRLAPEYREELAGAVLETRDPRLRRWVGVVALVLSLLAGLAASGSAAGAWEKVLLYLRRGDWGVEDPLFGRDVGFYVFTLPFWQWVVNFLFAALLVALLVSAVVHLVLGGLEVRQAPAPPPPGEPGVPPFLRRRAGGPALPQVRAELGGRAVAHLSALLAALFGLAAVGQLFRAWDLVFSAGGAAYGASATDVAVRLPLARVTLVLAAAIAAALVWNVWRRRLRWPAYALAAWVVALIILRGIVPAAYQSLVVNPNQLAKERTYIGYNLAATKAAYGLDRISQRTLPPGEPLTAATLARNAATVRNIRLWDPDTLTRSYRQLQELRPYYIFLDADVDRYMVNGVYRQTMLAARELNIAGLPPQAQTWVNQHMTYTHGFGVTVSAVNQVTGDGLPDFLVQDIPPRSVEGLEVAEPRIYYGERGTDYTLVRTREQEFDYPGRAGDVYREYTGRGGIPISPFLSRLAFSLRFGTIKFFTTSAFQDDSRIIIRNDIRERVEAAAPFLAYDGDPYMVIADGRLWWIVDAYTVSDRYPYSTPQGDLNYIRNSVKVVIDAYNGDMTFYVFDEKDPLLAAYRRVFPDLFTPGDEMPRELLAHVRYPEGLFTLQAQVWATYHVDSPDVLYNKGDQWAIPTDTSLERGRLPAYYVIMRLPGEDRAEFLQILPYTPNGRSNMIAWLAARSDPPRYGEMVNILFSKSTVVVGPSQVESFINQDPEISAQRSLWDQQGSRVILGNLLVVPIEGELLYVQPLYLQSEQTQVPQLKRVIVFYRRSAREGENDASQVVVMRPTLGEALAAAFGGQVDQGAAGEPGGQPGGPPATGRLAELVARANQEFDAAQQALRAGDFAAYGRHIEALQQALRALQRLRQ